MKKRKEILLWWLAGSILSTAFFVFVSLVALRYSEKRDLPVGETIIIVGDTLMITGVGPSNSYILSNGSRIDRELARDLLEKK